MIQLPKKYLFINDVKPLPPMLEKGLKYLGVHEHVGPGSNPIISEWGKNLSITDIYHDDDEAWCAVFINELCFECGLPFSGTGYDLIRSKSFYTNAWGGPVVGLPRLGDLGYFQRPGGGHIAIIIAQSKSTYHIFGGNQGNAVGFTEIQKKRAVGFRRPLINGFYKTYNIDSTGIISTNES